MEQIKNIYIVVYATTGENLDINISSTSTRVFTNDVQAKDYFNHLKGYMNSFDCDGKENYEIINDTDNEYTITNDNNDGMSVKIIIQEINNF